MRWADSLAKEASFFDEEAVHGEESDTQGSQRGWEDKCLGW